MQMMSSRKGWGDQIIASADKYLNAAMPTYSIPDGYRLLATSRDVYSRSKALSMAYILTRIKNTRITFIRYSKRPAPSPTGTRSTSSISVK